MDYQTTGTIVNRSFTEVRQNSIDARGMLNCIVLVKYSMDNEVGRVEQILNLSTSRTSHGLWPRFNSFQTSTRNTLLNYSNKWRMNRRSTTSAPVSAASQTSGSLSLNSQARMSQILDDQDHKRCSEGNQRALLAENLDQLRGLVKVLEADDWKHVPSSAAATSHFSAPFSLQSDSEFATSRW